ncbi:hypothetical protein MKK65_08165 [Methylobacterium sp. J-001]|uniref:hypothetical protein n=1 Tax=Methylobacterium sp. J-001 TaxID=2836609 RepID=UPI001FB91E2D|nr:hypothetical protein [Methylobacterium sp. J-001]MCJ2116554.1 hypothetical protein [Methylobacterium sp. J-001]
MSDDDQPKRRGRPPKSVSGPKVGTLTFRTRADFRERLEQAAAQSGRSVTEEVELRVERSFEMDRVVRRLDDLCSVFIDNGEMARNFATSLMANIASVQDLKTKNGEKIGSQNWSESLPTRAGIRAGAMILLDHYAPELDVEELETCTEQDLQNIKKSQTLADVWAKMATGQEEDIVTQVMRHNDSTS